MANGFNKEEVVAFDQMLEGFQDALVLSRNVSKYNTDQQGMERSGDTIWRPQPYIMPSFSGQDQSSNFSDKEQLSVPSSINIERSVPWEMTATELRDALQEKRLGESAKQKLASDINVNLMNVAATYGSLVVPVATAATGFDDVALVEAIMNEQGVMSDSRYLALSTRDYNGMASNLADRSTMGQKVTSAYERAYVGRLASFETYKLDYANRIAAAAGGAALTISTLDAANNYNPAATSVGTTGRNNVDNRFQTVTVSATTSVAAGDCFTIAALNAVHQITKQDTGQLKTFRVVTVDSGTTMTITPPIISNQVVTGPATQYQNCVINTKAANSAIVFLNKVAASINPFWHKDAIEIIPGKYAVPTDAGMSVMRGSTDQGIEIMMSKQAGINNLKTKYRVDVRFGVVNKAPEMSGILLFGQA